VASSGCPACSSTNREVFHRQESVPANSCLLLPTSTEAREFPGGSIELALCHACGFISNTEFDPALAEYSQRYEETQAFSPRFVEFARSLATRWVKQYDLTGRTVLEIGCGKGEFLAMMAEAGVGHGIGIDPGVHPERLETATADRLEWIKDFYTAGHADIDADAVVCRHTLEHILPVAEFLALIRTAVGDRFDVPILFELPDAQRVLDEVAFWDVYYEHCSYFTAGSLARLFERCGFEVLNLDLAYDGQYLLIESRPAPAGNPVVRWPVDDIAAVVSGAGSFRAEYRRTIERWSRRLAAVDGDVVIWGAGSKGVAFLAEVGDRIAAAVDINPHKHGMFIAGSGHEIIAPDGLINLDPELVIAMNPIYTAEIQHTLDELGVDAELVAL